MSRRGRHWRKVLGLGLAAGLAVSGIGCGSSASTRIEGSRLKAIDRTDEETIEIWIGPGADGRREATPPVQSAPLAGGTGERWHENRSNAMLHEAGLQGCDGADAMNGQSDVSYILADASFGHKTKDNTDRSEPRSVARDAQGLDDSIGRAIEEAAKAGREVRATITRPATEKALEETVASLRTTSDEAALNWKDTVRNLSLPWGESRGGGTGFTGTMTASGANVLHVIGGIAMLAAIVPVLIKPRRLDAAAMLGGTGLLLIAAGTVAEQHPWVFVLAMIATLGAFGYLAYSAWKAKSLKVALQDVAVGVENAPAEHRERVKESIEKAAKSDETIVRREVRAAKKQAAQRIERV